MNSEERKQYKDLLSRAVVELNEVNDCEQAIAAGQYAQACVAVAKEIREGSAPSEDVGDELTQAFADRWADGRPCSFERITEGVYAVCVFDVGSARGASMREAIAQFNKDYGR